MAGHGPAAKLGKDNASAWKSKLGVKLFVLYSLVYIGFVATTVITPKAMGKTVVFGLNLAVVYGMGLIVFAIILGLAYNAACTRKEDEMNKGDKEEHR